MKSLRMSAAAFAASMVFASAAQAIESYDYNDANGNPIFRARIFSTSDPEYGTDNHGNEAKSTWNLSQRQKNETLAGIAYWAEILKATPGQTPAIINIGTIPDTDNAFASSGLVPNLLVAPMKVQAAIQGIPPGDLEYGAHGQFVLGNLNFSQTPYRPSQLALGTGWDLTAVVYHEVAHTLGILSVVDERGNAQSGVFNPAFHSEINTFTAHLRDGNGNAAQPGQTIYCNGCVNPPAANVFDVRNERAYFEGEHVSEVLAGAMDGVPVRVTSYDFGSVDPNYLSHLELKNSLMSHQVYRNYTSFMEAELAVLQDIGYNIDRRNFFGYSIYNDGLTLINDNPYFGRNADGTAYVPNTYNMATQGVGLHVYGRFNNVFQRADLLTAGPGAAGIRVDGMGNNITVLPDTRIYADGAYARAVMFAYGKDHTFVQRGDVQALGEHGIAASFDFGNNPLGNDSSDYRGSYIHQYQGAPATLLSELNGPLVGTFDLTGRLAGKYAAIYMSENAYVGQINVMRGAALSGDILSLYSQVDANGAPYLTRLTFGLTPDENGQSTNAPDANFALRYDGNINGGNLSLDLAGGKSHFTGNHTVHDVTVAQGATLMGSGSYTLSSTSAPTAMFAPASLAAGSPLQFTNNGTVAPLLDGNTGSITVNGQYVQSSTGTLQVQANGANGFSRLIVNGNATLDGTLAIAPQRSWYANGFQLTSSQWLNASSVTGTFANVTTQLSSPTLTASASAQGNNTYTLAVSRAANAYSRYGADANGRQLGGALDRIAGTAGADLQPLVAALDFSAADGSGVRAALGQLSPAVYGAMFTGALLRERQITDIVAAAVGVDAVRRGDSTTALSGNWRAFAVPFGSGYWRGRNGDMPGASGNTYGVAFGAERVAGEGRDWTIGVHGAVSGQSTRLDGQTPGSGKTTALDIGVHARFAPDPQAGLHAFALARVGVEDGRVDRAIAVNGYTSTPRGTWTGATATASLGGGWRWALNSTTSAGPVAALDYAMLYRPSVTENGDGARLHLDGKAFSSLRTRVGAEIRFDLPTSVGNALSANLMATWNHELMGGAVTQGASFAGYPSAGFSTRTEVMGRDSLGLQAGVSYRLGQRIVFGAALASNFYRKGDADVAGSVSATWRF